MLHPQTRENLLRDAAGGVRLRHVPAVRRPGPPARAAGAGRAVRKGGQPGVLRALRRAGLDAGQIGMEAENLHLAIEEEAFEAEVCTATSRPRPRRSATYAAERFQHLREDGATATSSWPFQALDPADQAE